MSADRWGHEEPPPLVPPHPADTEPGQPDEPVNPLSPGAPIPCPVPNCNAVLAKNAFGPHLAMHRRNNDPGTPPPKYKSKAKGKRGRPPGTKNKPKRIMPVTPSDVTDGVLAVLYPTGIPVDRFRDVTAWVEATERLAAEAFAAQAEPEPS